MSFAAFDPQQTLLAIDTSSQKAGVALFDGSLLSQRGWPADRAHTTTVLAEIHHLLDAAGCDLNAVGAIGVAIGPGAFTGLRVGLGLAKGFHLATGVPLVGVPTLAAAALPFVACGLPVVAAVAAGRGRLVWATFASGASGLQETRSPHNGTVAQLAEELAVAGPVVVTGEFDREQTLALSAHANVILPTPASRVRQPGSVASLAWERWQSDNVDDATALEPVYLSR